MAIAPKPDSSQYDTIARQIRRGKVVPFLGAGINLADRGPREKWRPEVSLPNGAELAGFLAKRFPKAAVGGADLQRVAQYVVLLNNPGLLYDELHDVLDRDHASTCVHRLLARLPKLLEALGKPPPLIVTTNYDDLMERALVDEGVPFDVCWYDARGQSPERGKYWHRPPHGGQDRPIERPNEWRPDGLLERAPAVLKVHGAFDRRRAAGDSYVITEDDYVEYMGHQEGAQIPALFAERLSESDVLFLGYGLRDWNLRVLLERIWGGQMVPRGSWAVQREVTELDTRLWGARPGSVQLLDVELGEFADRLGKALDALAVGPA